MPDVDLAPMSEAELLALRGRITVELERRQTLAAGFLLSSRLSLIIAASAIALELGMISPAVNAAIILVAVVTVTVELDVKYSTLPLSSAASVRAVLESVMMPAARSRYDSESRSASIETSRLATYVSPAWAAWICGMLVLRASSSYCAMSRHH